jgi:hypothetical protein
MSSLVVGQVTLWTCCRIRVGATVFETTLDTIAPPGNSTLCQLFSESGPGSVFDEQSGLYMFPERICSDPAVFELVLDFLRTGQWLPIQNRRLNADVCRVAATLGIREMPPPVDDYGACTYDYVEVAMPHRPTLKEKLKQRRRLLEQIESGRVATDSDPMKDNERHDRESDEGEEAALLQVPVNSCSSVADLAQRGYRVVGERQGSKLKTGDGGGIISMPTTVLSLERKQLAQLPLVSSLAVVSPWFLTLSQCL